MADQITSATATAKTVRIAARKARLVIDLIRGRDVAEALAILEFTLDPVHRSSRRYSSLPSLMQNITMT